jgi:CheY-like chemotaxis protein
MMGSALEVESTYGVGSTFHFKLKQEVVNWEELGDYENAINERRKDHKKYREKFIAPEARVLVVDDNRMNLMVFGSLIKQTMVQIDTAESGAAGLELTGKNKYDIIFLDHMMPEMDGIETLRRLRNQTDGPNTTTPVICLTANAISGARESYISSGFEDYLSKPIDSGELEAMLIDFLPEDKIREPLEKKTVSSDSNIVPEELMPLMGSSIDVKAGIKSSGDLEFYKTVLKVFYETIDDKARELDHFFEEKDFKNYTIRIHALKSSARIIGAMAFGEAAQELENAGRAEDWDYLSSHHPGFMGAYRGFKELLSLVFAEQKTDAGPEASDKVMAGIYDRIRSAAEAMDYGELEDIIDEMSGYTIPEGERSKWDSIMSAFDRIDYDAVLEVLDQT